MNSKKRAIASKLQKNYKKAHDIQGIGLCLKRFGRFHTGEKETEEELRGTTLLEQLQYSGVKTTNHW